MLASPPPVDVLSDGTLAPPHFDYGLDTDGDTLYNYLVVDVNISVTVAGDFFIMAGLTDPVGGGSLGVAGNFTTLSPGPQTVPVWFNGIQIRASGINGPYDVDLTLFNDTAPVDFGLHSTYPYLYTQFQTPPAEFAPPHLDYGEDTDGDTFFNNLVLETVLNVTTPDFYQIFADLYDAAGSTMIASANWFGPLGSGIQVTQFRFRGYQIYLSSIDGPYRVELTLYDSLMNTLDNDTHMTQPYLFTDFEPTGGAMLSPPYSDSGVDTDGDLLYNYLVINIPFNVSEAGYYVVDGTLYDFSGMAYITSGGNGSSLLPGNYTFQLWLLGFEIWNSGFNGPYMLQIGLTQDMLLIDNDTYITNSYLSTDFEPIPGQFAPPHSDYGLDLDADTLFDYLVVNVSLNINEAGSFRVSGDLWDGTMSTYITWASNDTVLAPGPQIVQLYFPGFIIRNSGIDGPYAVFLQLTYDLYPLGSDVYFTGPYLFTDFDTPPVVFAPPHSDHGLDTDGDALFNYLVVDANVTVDISGTYNFAAMLYDGTGMTSIDFQINDTYLDVGSRTVEFRFNGVAIRTSGFDGPYLVGLAVQQGGNLLDTDAYLTNPYLNSQFQPPPAMFGSPHSDYGLDTDVPPDGYFDFLAVNVTVEVYEAGDFIVEGFLTHPMIPGGIIGINHSYLDVGTQVVPLRFSGRSIYLSGADGTFDVMLVLFTFGPGGPALLDFDTYTTGPYLHTQFQPCNPGFVWGFVVEAATGNPIPFAQVMAFNFTEGSVNQTSTDMTGYYSMYMHEGDYFITADDPAFQAEGSLVFVSGSTEVSMGLGPLPQNLARTSLTFSGWNNVNARSVMSMQQDNQSLRPMIEIIFGNGDWQLNSSEIESFMVMMGGTPSMPRNTTGMFYVDGIHYDLVLGSEVFYADDGGPVWNDAPLVFNIAGDFVSNITIMPSPTHLLNVNVNYDTPSEETLLRVDIPSSYYLQSYDPVTNVTVGGMGTPNIVVDPLTSPSPSQPSVWVNLTVQMTTDSTAPEISNVLIDGQPSVTYYLSSLPPSVQLTATIDDTATGNSIIDGANYTTPTATSWPGTYMSATDGAYDEPTEDVDVAFATPNVPGTYRYYVHAWDVALNRNDSAPYATIYIVDDLPPSISNVQIDGQTLVTYYLSSLPATMDLTAFVDDTLAGGDIIGGANYTTPTRTSWPGTQMNAVDGTFDEQSEDVIAPVSTPTAPGTYRYYVYAWDSGPNYNNNAPYATVVIVDDLAPQVSLVRVNGQASVTVNQGTLVTLTASTSDAATGGSDIAGANYTVGAAQWPGTDMTATDGAFDSPQEDVAAIIDTSGWTAGNYQICVYAWDVVPNRNVSSQACAQISIVVDTTPPTISQVLVGGQASVTVTSGTSVVLTAVVSDVGRGDSTIAGANYTAGAAQWPGTSMAAADGTFDSAQESVSATVNTAGWSEGTHELCVYGWDAAGMRNTTAQVCADIIIDDTPPALSALTANPDPQEPGQAVVLSATATDPSGISSVHVAVRYPNGTLLGNFTMTYDPGTQTYRYSSTYDVLGTYIYEVWARDTAGNYGSASSDFEIATTGQPPTGPSFIEQYWWALVLVVVIVVALLVFMLMKKRRPKVEAEGPEGPPSEQPPTETTPQEAPSQPPEPPQEPGQPPQQ